MNPLINYIICINFFYRIISSDKLFLFLYIIQYNIDGDNYIPSNCFFLVSNSSWLIIPSSSNFLNFNISSASEIGLSSIVVFLDA